MKKLSTKGLTLLEIMIGVLLISSATMVFIKVLNSFKKETVFYSEHFLASTLNEKVLETCFQEAEINPYGFQALGLIDEQGDPLNLKTMITDGQTPLFQTPIISVTSAPVLHQTLKDKFELLINCRTDKKGFNEVETTFSWKTLTGKGSSTSMCWFLTFAGDKDVATTYSLADSVVESRLLANCFDAAATSLGSVVLSFNAHELVMSIGHAYFPCSDFIPSNLLPRLEKIKALNSMAPSPASAEYAKCSAEYFSLAQDLLHLLMYIKPHLAKIRERKDSAGQVAANYRPSIDGFMKKVGKFPRKLGGAFVNTIANLASRYEAQFDNEFYLRDQKQILQRLFNFYRILYACRDHAELLADANLTKDLVEKRIRKFMGKLETVFATSFPAVARLAKQEIRYMQDGTLASRYFVSASVEKLLQDIDELANLQFNDTPGAGGNNNF